MLTFYNKTILIELLFSTTCLERPFLQKVWSLIAGYVFIYADICAHNQGRGQLSDIRGGGGRVKRWNLDKYGGSGGEPREIDHIFLKIDSSRGGG